MRSDILVLHRTQPAPPARQATVSEECEWLIDNAAAYDRVLGAIGAARQSIWMTQLALDPDCIAFGTSGSPDINVAEAIVEASASRGVDIRILMNQTLLLDTVKPLRKWLATRDAPTIRVRGMQRFPQLLHAKMIVIDGRELFLVGSPFVNGYWDDSRHAPVDSRRPHRELGGRPLHDVSIRVTGSAVAEAVDVFAEWWKQGVADAREMPERDSTAAIRPAVRKGGVRLLTTSPACKARRGRKDILEACIDGISSARSLIYIEHQYLSARPVVDALKTTIEKNKNLEVIIVLNQNPDVTAYRRWQNQRLTSAGLLAHPRVGVFSLWSTEQHDDRIVAASQVFVHSKVIIVDDKWAMAGSANLDGVSLHSYGNDFAGPFARRAFRNIRNFDVNVVVRDRPGDATRQRTVSALRTRLWAEHLGMNPAATTERPETGWLSLWRKQAAKNVLALDLNDSSHRFRGFVLPYSTRATPRKQWTDLGIREHAGSPKLQFNPGWAEVYLSPNWVRNMFL
jgi:phosphatidylserine/phosphatidylglycerophosphate/cardiolipin synthase-like enzyme